MLMGLRYNLNMDEFRKICRVLVKKDCSPLSVKR